MKKKNRGTLARRLKGIVWLSIEEITRLLSAIKSKRDKAIFLLAYRYGLRASEVALLRTGDVDLKQMTIRITRLKDSISNVQPMQPDEVKHLKAYMKVRQSPSSPTLFLSRENQGISRVRLHQLIKGYGKAAGLPKEKCFFHVLRHSIPVHLWDAGADLRYIQNRLGHASIQRKRKPGTEAHRVLRGEGILIEHS